MIYTFYSYKGGVGRSMALANVAELFYQAGLKVLMIDWDLEAPGLERFFPIPHEEVLDQCGIIDLLVAYKQDMAQEISSVEPGSLPFQNPRDLIIDIYKDSSAKGNLWLLTAGKRSNENFQKYAQITRAFNWQDFYQNWEGELYFEWLRKQLEEIADVVLIDSRTGVTEMGGVCTYQLADVIVMMCSASQQSLEGTLKMVLDFKRPEVMEIRNRSLEVVVVPARVEAAESDCLDEFQKDFIQRFSQYAPQEFGSQPDRLWQLCIPYISRYAYKETLAIPEKDKAHAQKLVEAFSKLAVSLSLLAEQDSAIRKAMPKQRIEIGNKTLIGTVVNHNIVILGDNTYIANSLQSSSHRKANNRHRNFFAYDDAWVGRENLIRDLSNRIRTSCRLLILIGITGIGKTSLGERLAVELEEWFGNNWQNFHQENFDDENQASNFANVSARWLEKWGEIITPADRDDPQVLLYRLIKHLCEHRYLVQIDSLENILQGDEEEGWSSFKDEWWAKFFDSYLKIEACQSCIILTSQDFPGQIEAFGIRSQNFWYCQPLSGLEQQEQMLLFAKIGLDINPSSVGRPYLERIGIAYEGHPLAMRVIAGEIKSKPFEGNVLAYWSSYGGEIEQVEKAIATAQEGNSVGVTDQWHLDRFTKALRRNLRSRLNKTFNRLKENSRWAYILLCEASVYRCPVPESFWLSHLEDWNQGEDEQRRALELLQSYNLIEEVVNGNQVLLRQHNLIRSLALEHLSQLGLKDE
jgi:cellulose biosynthesis protein BcsQ